MLFSSFEFIYYFFPIVFIGFCISRSIHIKAAHLWLIAASLFFYCYWKPIYLPLILVSVLCNYLVSFLIICKFNTEHAEQSKLFRCLSWIKLNHLGTNTLVVIGIIFNLGLLGFFKYFDFFIENFSYIALIKNPIQLNLLLPLGISFFTFQQIAYIVDCRKKLISNTSIINYSLFVLFFPQLIAGPIVHHSEMMPQFENLKSPFMNMQSVMKGLFLFSIGLFKKSVVADYLAYYVDLGYDNITNLSTIDAWATSLCYTFQLYYDFSGYTDMALGLALFFGINLPRNFNSPYKARNIQEFWKRWHMTLSRWLRDYIYIPLGGNRVPAIRHLINVFVVFLIGGIWHGAGWTFFYWGVMHGLAMSTYLIVKKYKIDAPYLVSGAITFMFINFTWIFFRAESMTSSVGLIKKMFDFSELGLTRGFYQTIHGLTGYTPINHVQMPSDEVHFLGEPLPIIFLLTLCLAGCTLFKNSSELADTMDNGGAVRYGFMGIASALLFMLGIIMLYVTPMSKFIYFNF